MGVPNISPSAYFRGGGGLFTGFYGINKTINSAGGADRFRPPVKLRNNCFRSSFLVVVYCFSLRFF